MSFVFVEAEHARDLRASLGLFCSVERSIKDCAEIAAFGLAKNNDRGSVCKIQRAGKCEVLGVPAVWREDEVAIGTDIAHQVEVAWRRDRQFGTHVCYACVSELNGKA
ncbi:MAG: hypothetical protein COB69_04760 [Phycisphaera sp.]|nr:MAG: hypothetical protein COB69_04760 [Phycisphaera sp.]